MRSDDELLSAYATRGDQAAFAGLVERHGAAVFRACLRIARDRCDAEDAAQAVFLVLARKAEALPREGRLAAWLHGVAWRVAKAQARARRLRERREAERMAQSRESGRGGDAERAGDALALLDRALAALPASMRQAVILRHLEGRSQEEAAAVAGCPVGTLAWRASAGLERLRRRLRPGGRELSLEALARMLESDAHGGPRAPESLGDLAARIAAGGPGLGGATAAAEAFRRAALWRGAITAAAIGAGVLLAALGTVAACSKLGARDARGALPARVVEPCPRFLANAGKAAWPEARAARELAGLRAHAAGGLADPGEAVAAVAAGTVVYAGSLDDPAAPGRHALVVIEHAEGVASPRGKACSVLLFATAAAPSITPGSRVDAGQRLGTARSSGGGPAPVWLALHEGGYRRMTRPFEARWRREAAALARETGIAIDDESRIEWRDAGPDAVEAWAEGTLVVNVALVRSFCGPEPNPPPLADWCFDDAGDAGWLDAAAWLRERVSR